MSILYHGQPYDKKWLESQIKKRQIVIRLGNSYKPYPEIGTLLPAMGYFDQQLKDLEDTINNTDCEVVVSATPIDITRLIKVNKPIVRVKYELEEVGFPKLKDVLKEKGFL